MGPRICVLDGGSHWRRLANTIGRCVRRCGLLLIVVQQLVLLLVLFPPELLQTGLGLVKRTCGDNWNSNFKRSTNQQY